MGKLRKHPFSMSTFITRTKRCVRFLGNTAAFTQIQFIFYVHFYNTPRGNMAEFTQILSIYQGFVFYVSGLRFLRVRRKLLKHPWLNLRNFCSFMSGLVCSFMSGLVYIVRVRRKLLKTKNTHGWVYGVWASCVRRKLLKTKNTHGWIYGNMHICQGFM